MYRYRYSYRYSYSYTYLNMLYELYVTSRVLNEIDQKVYTYLYT